MFLCLCSYDVITEFRVNRCGKLCNIHLCFWSNMKHQILNYIWSSSTIQLHGIIGKGALITFCILSYCFVCLSCLYVCFFVWFWFELICFVCLFVCSFVCLFVCLMYLYIISFLYCVFVWFVDLWFIGWLFVWFVDWLIFSLIDQLLVCNFGRLVFVVLLVTNHVAVCPLACLNPSDP